MTKPAVREFTPPTEDELFNAGLYLEVKRIDEAISNLSFVRDGLVKRAHGEGEEEDIENGLAVPIQHAAAAIDRLKEMLGPRLSLKTFPHLKR